MRKKADGYLTVEATITLTIFLFFMMFIIMNMGQIYRAQNYVTHGLLQSGKLLAYNSFAYEDPSVAEVLADLVETVLYKISAFWGANWFANDNMMKLYWNVGGYNTAVKEAFGYCAGASPGETDATLRQYGLSQGIDSITFDVEKDDDSLLIKAEYDITLPFSFFGFDHVTMHQQVKCGLWSTGDDD